MATLAAEPLQHSSLPDRSGILYTCRNTLATNNAGYDDFVARFLSENPGAIVHTVDIANFTPETVQSFEPGSTVAPCGGDSTHRYAAAVLIEAGMAGTLSYLPTQLGRTNEVARNAGVGKRGYKTLSLDAM